MYPFLFVIVMLSDVVCVPVVLVDRLSKNQEEEEEDENTVTFSLKCIVTA